MCCEWSVSSGDTTLKCDLVLGGLLDFIEYVVWKNHVTGGTGHGALTSPLEVYIEPVGYSE